MAKTLTQVGIETGTIVEAYHVTQSIDAFTGADAYDITLSGSFTLQDGTQGADKIAVSDVNGKISFTNSITASLQGTASYAATALSASYIVGGGGGITPSQTSSFLVTASSVNNTITFTKGDGTTFPITINTGSGGGGITPSQTGSFYYSSSVDSNIITFYQGDGTQESVTVDTGSGGTPFTYDLVTSQNYSFPDYVISPFKYQDKDARFFLNDSAGNSNFYLPEYVSELGVVIEIFYAGSTGTLEIHSTNLGIQSSILLHTNIGGSTTSGGSVITPNGEACYIRLMATSGSTDIGFPGVFATRWRISNYWDDTTITTSDPASNPISSRLTLT